MKNNEFVHEGSWHSIHVMEVIPHSDGTKAQYKLTTTVMLHMNVDKQEVGNTNMSGTLTRRVGIDFSKWKFKYLLSRYHTIRMHILLIF